jgi:hypothetical protein
MHRSALERAIARVANERIEQAINRGEFDDLPDRGKPLAVLDEPYDPNWWVRRWSRRQNLALPQLYYELRRARNDTDDNNERSNSNVSPQDHNQTSS